MKTLLRDLRDLALWAQIPARLLEPDLASGLPASRSQLSEDAARSLLLGARRDVGWFWPLCEGLFLL